MDFLRRVKGRRKEKGDFAELKKKKKYFSISSEFIHRDFKLDFK